MVTHDTLTNGGNGDARNVGGAGLNAVFSILDKWGCDREQILNILQISKSAYHKYRADPKSANLGHDQLERLSYVLNIHAALRIVFDNPDNVYGFMSMPNHNPFFNGATPLEVITSGHFGALYETHNRIDALRGGDWM